MKGCKISFAAFFMGKSLRPKLSNKQNLPGVGYKRCSTGNAMVTPFRPNRVVELGLMINKFNQNHISAPDYQACRWKVCSIMSKLPA